jgi:molybdenum cofactor cytidylyltransferase/nicotine blue oxidoreductase
VTLVGLLLAAGAGRRMGGPKALLRDGRGVPFLDRMIGVLFEGGCERVTVVVGAAAPEVTAVLVEAGWVDDPAVDTVVAEDWQEGMGASLRAGLRSLGEGEAALVTLVDLPDVDEAVVRRVAGVASGTDALVRATYDGRPGHPVLIGRNHWPGVLSTAHDDQGAREYLATHDHLTCECGDLATGKDVDGPDDLSDS